MFPRTITPAFLEPDHANGLVASSSQPTVHDLELTPEELLNPKERRASRRFPIELVAELTVGSARILGTTVNISSGGLLMTCSGAEFQVGTRVTVRVAGWPAKRRRNRKVALILQGRVVRSFADQVAVRRLRYEFFEA